MNEDDDFWGTYIAATPDEDSDFAGCCGPTLLLLLAAVGVLILLAAIL